MLTTRTGESQANAGAAGQVRRTSDGKPDFSGIWQANTLAHWDLLSHDARPIVAQRGAYPDVPVLAAPVVALGTIGWIPADVGVVDGDEIPYQPWAAARQKENFANWLDRDPEIRCYLPGVPRAMYLPYKFQIIQGTTKVMMAFEFRNADRTIHLDEVVPYPGDAFMGHSVGRWEGDSLVVPSRVSRPTPGSTGPAISTAMRSTSPSGTRRSDETRFSTRRGSKTQRSSRAPGQSGCPSTAGSSRTRGSCLSDAWKWRKRRRLAISVESRWSSAGKARP